MADHKDFIKGAIKHPGSFRAAAQKAGKSTKEFAREHYHDKGTLGKRARLAYTLMGLHGSGKSTPHEAGDKRSPAQKLYQVG